MTVQSTVDEKTAILDTRFGKTPADFKTDAGKDYKKADYDAMFTAENGADETMLATHCPSRGPTNRGFSAQDP